MHKITFKEIFFRNIKNLCENEKNIGVALSSGKDSNAILLALLELGYNPKGYSFHVEGNESFDYLIAKENCNKLNIPFTECIIPKKADKEIVINYITKYSRYKKVELECQYNFYYLFPKVTEKIIMIGWSAGTIFPLSKKVCINYKHDIKKLNHWRDVDQQVNTGDIDTFNLICKDMNLNLKVKDPFYCFDMLEWVKKQSWDSLHKPHQKQVLLDLFPDKWKLIDYKPQTSLQCGDSGIREIFNHLLKDKHLNYNKRNRVLDLYKDIYELNLRKGNRSLDL